MDPPMTAASRPARLLTLREREVMHWVSQGKSNWEVARVEQTVKKHLQHIYRKLGVENRMAAALVFIKTFTKWRSRTRSSAG